MADPVNQLEPMARETSLRDYMDILWRRKEVAATVFLVIVLASIFATLIARRRYRVDTQVLVEPKSFGLGRGGANELTSLVSDMLMPDADHDVSTQMEVISSKLMLTSACVAAGLPADAATKKHPDVRVNVKQVKDTDVLEIAAESENAAWAQKLGRQLPITYLHYVTDSKKSEVISALNYAEGQLAAERYALNNAERAMEDYKAKSGVISLEDQRAAHIQQAQQAASNVADLQAQVSGSRAALAALLTARNSLPQTETNPITITNNLQIDDINNQIAQLNQQREALLVTLKPNNRQVQQVDAQISALKSQLANTPATVTTKQTNPNPVTPVYEENVQQARATLENQQAALLVARAKAHDIEGSLAKYGPIERKEVELLRDIDEHTLRFDQFDNTVQELSIRKAANHDPVTVVSAASLPEQVAPRPVLNVFLGLLFGLLLGIGAALFWEYIDDHLTNPEDARRQLGLPVLGFVPSVGAGKDAPMINAPEPDGLLLECYRVLRSNVQFALVDATPRSLVVTSTMPSEGKSVTAANLAISMARDGAKVILVDADFRRPTQYQKFNVGNSPGLTAVLTGTADLETALRRVEGETNLSLLPAGASPPNPAEILNSKAMRDVHARMREIADVVIFDMPPCLATADAQVMSADVDGVLYVMQFGVARRSAVLQSMELLRQARAHVLGLVFNKMDVTSRSNYYGYYNYYDAYRKYSTAMPRPSEIENGASAQLPGNKES